MEQSLKMISLLTSNFCSRIFSHLIKSNLKRPMLPLINLCFLPSVIFKIKFQISLKMFTIKPLNQLNSEIPSLNFKINILTFSSVMKMPSKTMKPPSKSFWSYDHNWTLTISPFRNSNPMLKTSQPNLLMPLLKSQNLQLRFRSSRLKKRI